MKHMHQRVALLTGVSICVLGIAAPAAAATVPGVQHNINDSAVDDVLTLSDIGDDPAFYGVTADGTSLAYAIVQDVNSGEVVQGGNATTGDVTLLATNAGEITIGAIGHAVNASASAAARGHVERAISQVGTGPEEVSLDLHNTGDVAVVASGIASGTAALGLATISTAILQIANGNVASVGLANGGEIDIDASGVARAGVGNATAVASIHGIAQTAHGLESGLVSLTNEGTIDIEANASADGFIAGLASANVAFGIAQTAWGAASDGFAGLVLDNSGTIAIDAHAVASAEISAAALAHAGTGVYQHATGSGGGAAATLTNSATMSFSASASADAHNDGMRTADATARANARGTFQVAVAKTLTQSSGTTSSAFHYNSTMLPHGPASIALDNSGTIALDAHALASADDGASASAAVTIAWQSAEGTDDMVVLTNSGEMSASATAQAVGGGAAHAAAFATGIFQGASAHGHTTSLTLTSSSLHLHKNFQDLGPASVSLANTGSITLVADAEAVGNGGAIVGSATAQYANATAHIGIGINQQAFGTEASVTLDNEGTISLDASAAATGAGGALALAEANGFSQAAYATGLTSSINATISSFSQTIQLLYVGPATNQFTNTGSFSVTAVASADGADFAQADAREGGGIQVAVGDTAVSKFENSGSFTLAASAEAVGSFELANAHVDGLQQFEKGFDSALASVANSGTMSFSAHARGTASQGGAFDFADLQGIGQNPISLGTATAAVVNGGTISFEADAHASGATAAFAGAHVLGTYQAPMFGELNAKFVNDGTYSIAVQATAAAESGFAGASAVGTAYTVDSGRVVLDVANSGTISAAASAAVTASSGSAYAYADGIAIIAANHSSATTVVAGTMSGAILNSGELKVSAKAVAEGGDNSGATATGIYLMATRNNATVTNSGLIDVEAVTGDGGPAHAYGVDVVTGFRGQPATPGDVFTFTNDGGTIVARQSTDGGDTWHRGMAIDVSQAPNRSVINLTGDGSIYGNIAVQKGDEINVADGTTYFDGVIGPAHLPAGGIDASALDSGLSGEGALTIADGGNLVLADPRLSGDSAMYDGPAYAILDTLEVAPGGTLTFGLEPAGGGAQTPGSYSQLFADSVELDGTLAADVAAPEGLFADSYSWDNVIDAEALSGKFDQCVLGGRYAGSLLLKLGCSYDSGANVDLTLTRLAFDKVGGLNRNGKALATAIEALYPDLGQGGQAGALAAVAAASISGPAAAIGDLFLIADPAKYNAALNMLSGSVYANYLNSFPSLGVHENDLTDHATNCEAPALSGSVLECRSPAPVHVWGQLDYQARTADGDTEAGTTRSKRFTGLLGIDFSAGHSLIVGIDGGHLSNKARDRQFGDEARGDGWTVGGYAVYDPGSFFLKGVTTYSSLSGDSHRYIGFAPLATGATFAATPTGHPDVKMWTAGLHGGARLPMGAASVVTAYLNYDYVNAKLDRFGELNGNGAELTIDSSKSNHSFLTGGVRWAGQMGGVVPEANLGYRERFGNESSTFHGWFTGAPSDDFTIVSASQKKGTLLAGLSVGGKLGPVDVRVGYEGEFNGDVASHSGNFKLVLPLGGHAAPPPSPPVTAAPPPPPPPPPATQTCPDGPAIDTSATCPPPPPPSPPAPVESGERGH